MEFFSEYHIGAEIPIPNKLLISSSLQPVVFSLAAKYFLLEIHQHQQNVVEKQCMGDKEHIPPNNQCTPEENETVKNMKRIKNLLNLIIYQPEVFIDMDRTKSE